MDSLMYMLKVSPVACPRPRVTKKGFVYYPAGYTAFKTAISKELADLEIPPFDKGAPLVLRATFFMPKPKRGEYIGYHYKKPDLDNLVKSLCDGLEAAGVIPNDSQFSQLDCVKRYSPNPKIMFMIEYLDEEENKEGIE